MTTAKPGILLENYYCQGLLLAEGADRETACAGIIRRQNAIGFPLPDYACPLLQRLNYKEEKCSNEEGLIPMEDAKNPSVSIAWETLAILFFPFSFNRLLTFCTSRYCYC